METFKQVIKNYPGGKSGAGTYQAIINQFPPHDQYIEGFLGSGAILRKKKPALSSIGIDIDTDVCIAWNRSRFPGLVVKNDYFHDLVATFDYTISTLIYLDPPYPHCVRKDLQLYRHEMTDSDHSDLLQSILTTPAMVAISSYENDLYNEILAGWRKFYYKNTTRTGQVIECLYCNFPAPVANHDTKYAGLNRTDRQRIKRKAARWVKNLHKLPFYEQQAIMEMLLKDNNDTI